MRRIRYSRHIAVRMIQMIGLSPLSTSLDSPPWIATLGKRTTLEHVEITQRSNSTGSIYTSDMGMVQSFEELVVNIIDSVAFPILQMICAMLLADSLQYFTHRGANTLRLISPLLPSKWASVDRRRSFSKDG